MTEAVTASTPLSDDEVRRIDAYWRAANYLSVGQIYLLGNPLLREPLRRRHIKPRLLGHWGTSPGLNFCYVHLNRAIIARDLDDYERLHREHLGRLPGVTTISSSFVLRSVPTRSEADALFGTA